MAKRLKLKGKTAEKLSKERKAKMEKTLTAMEKTREKDSLFLRDLINKKLEWAQSEKQKGLDAIGRIKNQVLRLDGAVAALKELLQAKKEENVNSKD